MLKFDLELIEECIMDDVGLCVSCGSEKECCEPDARKYKCEECEELTVYGAEEILLMGLVEDEED